MAMIRNNSDWLDGVWIDELDTFLDERGKVQRFYRENTQFLTAKECYVTHVNPGIVKGWHGYVSKRMMYACIKGNVKLVLYDNRVYSATYGEIQELYLGEDNYKLVVIPSGIMNSFKGISADPSVVIVVADEIFDEAKTIRWPLENEHVEYDWSKVKNG